MARWSSILVFCVFLAFAPVSAQDQWTQCDASEAIRCASCIFKCGAGVVGDVIELAAGLATEQPEIDLADVAEWEKTALDCADCASACSLPIAQFNAECPSTNHCNTDFCYTCCVAGAQICVGNDWGQTCVPPNRQCICSSNSGDSNSCRLEE